MQTIKTDKYIEGIGRRKNAIARVRLTKTNKASFSVNGKEINEYFSIREMQHIASEALKNSPKDEAFTVTAKVKDGGIKRNS